MSKMTKNFDDVQIDAIETSTGYDFLNCVPGNTQKIIEM